MSFRACSKKQGISTAVLSRRAHNPHMKPHGGQTVLSKDAEKFMTKRVARCATLGYPLDSSDVPYLVKGYLDKRGLVMSRYKNNMRTKHWVNSFVRKNQEIISHRICQNIKPTRASLSPSTVKILFSILHKPLETFPHQT